MTVYEKDEKEKQLEELVDAMAQLLDDMGKEGQSVCLYNKAKARIAYEPFRDPEADDGSFLLDLEHAKQIITECD